MRLGLGYWESVTIAASGLALAGGVLAFIWGVWRLVFPKRKRTWSVEEEAELNRAGLETFPIARIERGIRPLTDGDSRQKNGGWDGDAT